MRNVWSVQDAKNRFSAVVDEAGRHGPQVITRRGAAAAVMLSAAEYRRLAKPKTTLVEFFRRSPLHAARLRIVRLKDPPREVRL